MTFDHPEGLVVNTGGDNRSNILRDNATSQDEDDQVYARSTHFVPPASQMILHEEADPDKKTMDFAANAGNLHNNVPFFETELKDLQAKKPHE